MTASPTRTSPEPSPGVTDALALLGEVVWIADHNANLVYLSPSWTELTGFRIEESLGRGVFEVVHPSDLGMARAATALLKAEAIDAIRERARIIRADGSERWVEVFARMRRDASGTYRTVGSMREIPAPGAPRDAPAREIHPERVDGIAGAFFTVATDGALIFASDSLCALLGLAPQALRSGVWMRQLREDDRTRLVKELIPRALAGAHVSADVHHVAGPSAGRIFALEMRPIDTGGITNEAFIGTLRDVTVQRQAERQSDQMARAASELFDLMQEAFVYFDPHGRAVRANANALRLLRLEQDAFDRDGIPFGRFALRKLDGSEFPVDPFEQARRDRVALTGLAGGFHWPDGTLNWVTLNYVPLPAAEGEAPALFWTFNDITATRQESERQRAIARADVARRTAEVSEREARLLAAVTSALARQASYPALAGALQMLTPYLATWCSIDLLNPDGTLQRVAHTDADAQRNPTRLPDPTRDGRHPIFRAVRSGNPVIERDIGDQWRTWWAQPPAGFVVPDWLAVYPLTDADRVIGVFYAVRRDDAHRPLTPREMAIFEDVAATLAIAMTRIMLHEQLVGELAVRKAAELALAHERAHLADLVEARTRELTERNEQLAAASLAKDQFLASMSHELRTPLNAILGMSEAVQDETFGSINDQQRAALRDVTGAGEHLLALINDILDLTRIAASDQVLEPGPSNVLTLADATVRLMRPLAEARTLSFSWTNDAGDLPVTIDERRVKQVLVNLVGNAIKFTPGGGSVAVISRVRGDMLCFEVHDTGIGIAPEDQARVFEPFVQLDGGLDRQFPGTGLGLPLVRRMVEAMGGTVTLDSEIGRGSIFTVRIPLTS
jgi:PAS domain S-box-containing protein